MIATATQAQLKPLAILSLLGDSLSANAATRTFRGRTVLEQTVGRIRAAASRPDIAVLVWDDQLPLVMPLSGDGLSVEMAGRRRMSVQMNLANASLRWADGWRGGLLGVSTFDRGFDARVIQLALEKRECNAAILIDPNAALIDPASIDAVIDHLLDRPALEYAFQPGAPGSGAMILRVETIRDLQRSSRHPGQLLAYHPDRPQHDPLAKEFAVPVSPRVARSLARLTLDSDRQIGRISLLQSGNASSDSILDQLQADSRLDSTPREVVVEITTRRATTPIFSVLRSAEVNRSPMGVACARRLFAQLAKVDDLRLTFAGVGDPLLHDNFDEILFAAREAGLDAIHVETDLLATRTDYLDLLTQGHVDVVSIHLPAVSRQTYRELMGVDRVPDVLNQLKYIVSARSRNNSGLPIIVPLFTKCEQNMGEMEEWYDQWIRALGAAVVRGPSDFGGEIPFVGVSDMLPPIRKPCRRLRTRMTILSDGTIASCEEDVLGRQAIGHVDRDSVELAWTNGLQPLRLLPATSGVCVACRMWDRP